MVVSGYVELEWEVLDSMLFIGIQRSTDKMDNKWSTTGLQANPVGLVQHEHPSGYNLSQNGNGIFCKKS
jgi:hypothetical protein